MSTKAELEAALDHFAKRMWQLFEADQKRIAELEAAAPRDETKSCSDCNHHNNDFCWLKMESSPTPCDQMLIATKEHGQ